jgi:quercetin dioxygenase-like cupin family protein
MRLEDRSPLHVANRRSPLSRIDDIGEENSGQNAIWLDWLMRSIHEYFGKHRSAFLKPNEMISARQFYHSSIGNCGSHFTGVFDRAAHVANVMNNQCWSLNARQDWLQSALLYGDPTKAGVYVIRWKYAPGAKVMPHWHPDEVRTATVLSGTYYFAIGDQWDESKFRAFPAGSFISEPPNTPHYAWAKDGDVIVQFTGVGPTGTTMIPQKAQ